MAKLMLRTLEDLPYQRAWAGQETREGTHSVPGAAGEREAPFWVPSVLSLSLSTPTPPALSPGQGVGSLISGEQVVGARSLCPTCFLLSPQVWPLMVLPVGGEPEEPLCKTFPGRRAQVQGLSRNASASGYWSRLLKTHFLFYKVR